MVVALTLGRAAIMAAPAIAGDPHVIEIRRGPCRRGVAGHTILGGGNMLGVLALRGAAIVAALTVTGDTGVSEISR